MAIALDSSQNSGAKTTRTYSFNHTCTGSNMILFVSIGASSGNGYSGVSVKYNNVSMVNIGNRYGYTNSIHYFYLVNPNIGTNSIDVDLGATMNSSAASISLTGVDQTNPIDNYIDQYTWSTSLTLNITANYNNSYALQAITVRSNPAFNTGTRIASILYNGVYESYHGYGYYAAGNSGSKSFSYSWQSNYDAAACVVLFREYVSTTSIKSINGLAYSSVKSYNGLAKASIKSINGLT